MTDVRRIFRVLTLALSCIWAIPGQAADMRSFEAGSWTTLSAAHQGQPLIVHFWGMTCGPCLLELPKWAAFLRRNPQAVFVLISSDPVSENPAALSATLAKAGLSRYESWTFAGDFQDRLRYEIDPQWRGELPRTLLISRDGRRTTVAGVVDFATVTDWLKTQ